MMNLGKEFIDEVLRTIEINTLVERRKCRATGKVRFNRRAEATFFIYWLKWNYEKWRQKKHRRKHQYSNGGGRPKQRYVYNCEFCGGYHITKEHPHDYKRKKEKYEQKYAE
ncbi:hypothetical protein [Sphingobacterium multivorum]|uniref:hypothetical protein n=1 Tax=Sphingobacterium TaxID=28453 RepID=UPI0026D2F795|nr:hypothetical protein [Sphingobacterium multivorum]